MSAFECPETGNPLMPSCRLVADTLSDYLDGQLSDQDQLLLDQHLAACPLCVVYLNQFREVYHAAGRVEPADLPDDFERVLGGVIQRWQAERRTGSSGDDEDGADEDRDDQDGDV